MKKTPTSLLNIRPYRVECQGIAFHDHDTLPSAIDEARDLAKDLDMPVQVKFNVGGRVVASVSNDGVVYSVDEGRT